MRLTIRHGGVTAKLSVDLSKAADRAWGLSENAAVQEMNRERDAVYENARGRWPVKTGKSRAGLDAYNEVAIAGGQTGTYKAGVRNPVEYVKWIRFAGSVQTRKVRGTSRTQFFRGAFVLTSLLRTPTRRAGKRLIESLGPVLREQLDRALPTGKPGT